MHLVLDFSAARTGACHSHGGVSAVLDGRPPVIITITPDGCTTAGVDGPTIRCVDPDVTADQAWAVAVLIAGGTGSGPRSPGRWTADRKTVSFTLSDGRGRMMM